MSLILVTPLSAIEDTIRSDRPSHLVTLLSPEHMIETPEGIAPDRHLKLAMNDVADEWAGESPPHDSHIDALLDFGRGWDAQSPMLVHCWAGVSRSTAAAYILLCDRAGKGAEIEIARAIRERAPHASPNPLMVRLADDILGRGGRMVSAVDQIGRGIIVTEGKRVELPLIARVK
ncbi:MAG: hypothetical protein HY243_17225 [Proteobacteria bacterium]|nr:hypothetical protein [Pseudomonadota bacterium]